METDYTEKDILIELNRRFYIHSHSDGTCSLRTKYDWYIYYAENGKIVVYYKGKSVLKEWFKMLLGKEMFYYTDLTSSPGIEAIKTFRFSSSFEELCIMNDLEGM